MSIESIPVSSVMTKDVKTATEGQTIRGVAALMSRHNIECVVIAKKGDNRCRWAWLQNAILSSW
jgi:CBS domain-containing protein